MRLPVLPLVLLVSLSACGKDEPAAKPTPSKAAEVAPPVVEPAKPEPPKRTIAAPTGVLGCKTPAAGAPPAPEGALAFKLEACPTIPSIFGTLAWGMDQEAVGKAIKGIKFDTGGPYGTTGRFKVGKQNVYVNFSEVGKVEQLRFKASPAGLAAMTAAWGAPLEVEFLGRKDMVWLNPAAKIKVEVDEDTSADDESEKYTVRYHVYTPLADLFGPEGVLSKPIIGATGEELQKNFPEWLVVKAAGPALGAARRGARERGRAARPLLPVRRQIRSGGGPDLGLHPSPRAPPRGRHACLECLGPHGRALRFGRFGQGLIAAALGAPTGGKKNDEDEWTYNFAGPNGTKVELRDLGKMWSVGVEK